MQESIRKDASAPFRRFARPGRKESGWENMKSPRKTTSQAVALVSLAAAILAWPLYSIAQDPPPAPVPKVAEDPKPQQPTPQEAQAPANQQTPSDSQTT